MPKINREEYEVLKGLDDKWKWIARDDNYGGFIFCFREKPYKDIRKGGWSPDTTQYKCLWEYDVLFQFIQWEDEEPYNIQKLIENFEEAIRINEIFEKTTKIGLEESEETEVKNKAELKSWFEDDKLYVGKYVKHKINRLDEPEANSQIDKLANFIMSEVEGEPSQNQGAVDTAIRIIKSYQNQETLSQEWIDKNVVHVRGLGDIIEAEAVENLIVPKQEEVDRAYKDGYEKGKQHTFYKGYLEGLTEGERKTNEYFESITEEPSYEQVQKYLSEHGIEIVEREPKTVADVVSTFWKSFERLKEVMSMEVEELEE